MSNTISCPSCHRPLRVPETLLGQLVKCPTCGETFPAALDSPAREAPPERDREEEAPRPPSRRDDEEDRGRASRRDEDEDEGRRRRRSRRDDYDEEGMLDLPKYTKKYWNPGLFGESGKC